MSLEEDFFSEFYYPDEIVMENEHDVDIFLSTTSAKDTGEKFPLFSMLWLSEAI